MLRSTCRVLAVSVAAAMLAATAACGVIDKAKDAVDDAIAAVNHSIDVVDHESGAWRNELPQLQEGFQTFVAKAQAQASNDAQKMLADAGNDLAALTADTIKLSGLTAQDLLARFGAEARCNLDFTRTRVAASLRTLVEGLKFWQIHRTLPPPPPHAVCQITPGAMEITTTAEADRWSMTVPKNKIIGVFGYDFRGDALPKVVLHTATGDLIRPAKVSVTYRTRYELALDFGPEDFAQISDGARYVLDWPDHPEPNGMTVTLVRPSKLVITKAEISPPAPRAKADLVQATVTVKNTGGSNSDSFVVTWIPGPDAPIQSASVQNVPPGQDTTVSMSYTYPQAGVYPSIVQVGSGDTAHLSVTVAPYANLPREQSVPVRWQWPGAGGEPGQTKSSDSEPIQLGPDCELDTTRGGGSFTVADIDKPTVTYLIAWPPGYDFGFGDNTFWRSFSAVSARYDAQQRQAKATITLKGLGGHGLFGTRGPERYSGSFTVYSLCPR